MKRDLDLLRAILLHIFMFYPNELCSNLELEDYRPTQVRHHIELLHQSGMIFRTAEHISEDAWDNLRLTNVGYDFIALASDPLEWTTAKELVMVKTGSQHFGMVCEVLSDRARNKLRA